MMSTLVCSVVTLLFLSSGSFLLVDAFSTTAERSLSSSDFVSRRGSSQRVPKIKQMLPTIDNNNPSLFMRDASASYWFSVGDSVRVVSQTVVKAGINLHQRQGKVVETWEKCDGRSKMFSKRELSLVISVY